jgi:hypothetical protein
VENLTIVLAGQSYEVVPPPFGKLRKIIAAFNRMQSGGDAALSESDDAALVIGLLVGKTSAEVDEMPINFKEMIDALASVPKLCGLEMVVPASGEEQVETIGIPSTAT